MKKSGSVFGLTLLTGFSLLAGSIYDEAVWHFEGGRDGFAGGTANGLFDKGEMVDALHAGVTNHANHQTTKAGFDTNVTWSTESVPFAAAGLGNLSATCLKLSASYQPTNQNQYCFATVQMPFLAALCPTNVYSAVFRLRRDAVNPYEQSEWCVNFGYSGNSDGNQGWMLGFDKNGKFAAHGTGSSAGTITGDLEVVPTNKWVDIGVIVCSNLVTLYQAFSGSDTTSVETGPARMRWATLPFKITLSSSAHKGEVPNLSMRASCIKLGAQQTLNRWYDYPGKDGNMPKFFCGTFQRIAFWNRALTRAEITEAFAFPRPGLLTLGTFNGHADEFSTASAASATQTVGPLETNPWNTFPATLAAGDTRTINFSVAACDTGLAQILVLKTLPTSAAATFRVTLNGRVINPALAVPPGEKVLEPIRARKSAFVSGTNTLVLERTDAQSGTVTFDAVWLGGSWSVKRTTSYGWHSTRSYNAYFDVFAIDRALNVKTRQKKPFYQTVTTPRAVPTDWPCRFGVRLHTENPTDDAELTFWIDGQEVGRAGHPTAQTDYWFDLTPGEHDFKMTVTGTEGVYWWDNFTTTFVPPPRGLSILLR